MLQLSLLELNTLYYALGKRELEAKREFIEYGGEFFKRELDRTSKLLEKVSAELDKRVK